MENSDLPSFLFVCLGNICRSPLAEGAFRKVADNRGLTVQIDSAGTGDWHIGKAPDPRAIATAARHGVTIDTYRARQIVSDDFERFSHIFALDAANLHDIRAIAPPAPRAQVSLLLDLIPGRQGQSVADPYFGDEAGFEVTWDDVMAAALALADDLAGRG